MLNPKFIIVGGLILILLVVIAGFFIVLGLPAISTKKMEVIPENQKATTVPSLESTSQTSDNPQTQIFFDKKNVSVDDDPVMGNPDAKITIIEFSDFECPRCKTFFDQTLPQLKTEYIDTGIVKLVYRDFLIPNFANSPKESQAAECARDQGGDEVYFKYHDEIFKRTRSNGSGLPLDQLPVIASDLGLDVALHQQCLASDKYRAEVEKDTADGKAVQVAGTPTFFIGKVNASGEFEGMKLGGAYPFRTFQLIIDEQLKQL